VNPAPIKALSFRETIERKKDREELRGEIMHRTQTRKPKRKRK
jgi:hypothetical protein